MTTANSSIDSLVLPKTAWDTLSMKEKADVMKVAVRHGITSLQEIRQRYNEFAEGGSKGEEESVSTDEQYLTTMEKVAQDNYRKWGFNNPDEALLHALNDNTYDYRGYYKKYPQSSANADTHWNDEFKTVYHPTFSNESVYSGRKSQYNPFGLPGGFWSGETFIPMAWQLDANKYDDGGFLEWLKGIYHGTMQTIGLEDTPEELSLKRGKERYGQHGYIGGNPRETRQKYFTIDKEFTDSVNSISKRYGLNPSVVASRIAEEGPIDNAIDVYNNKEKKGTTGLILSDDRNKGTFGPLWGLDDFYTRASDEKVKVTTSAPHSYKKRMFINEHGRMTESIVSPQWWFGIEATAAEMKARRDKLKKNNPWMNNQQLDAATAMSFNYGEWGVQKHINQKKPIPKRFNPYIKTK